MTLLTRDGTKCVLKTGTDIKPGDEFSDESGDHALSTTTIKMTR